MSEHKKIFRSAGVVSLFTLLSRILGFGRDVIIARLFGTQAAAQAFVVAFRIPNTLRTLIGEGATNAAVIPVLSEYLGTSDRKEFWQVANVLLNIFAVVLFGISLLGILFTPVIVKIIAFGFTDDPAKFALTIRLTRLMFFFVFFIGLTAYAMGVLNSLKNFAVSAASSCMLNLTMIVFGLFLAPKFSEPIMGMGIAVLIGGFLQLAIQVPVLMKNGFRPRYALSLKHPAVRKITKLLLPRMLGSSIYQFNIFVDTMFASFGRIVGDGAIAALYYATRLIQFPTALFGIAMATAALPSMSEHAVAGNEQKLKETLILAIQTLVVFLLPSSIGLMVLSYPITKVLFERGQFDQASTSMTAMALLCYCIGIFAYSAARVVTSCFYALKDTMTPVKVTFVCLIVNVVLNYLLMWPLKVAGIALATSISSTVNFLLLVYYLRLRLGLLGFKKIASVFLSVLTISLIMGLVCWLVNLSLSGYAGEKLGLLGALLSGIAVFFALSFKFEIFRKAKLIA